MPNSIPRLNVVVASYNRLDLAANFWPYDKVTVTIARIRRAEQYFSVEHSGELQVSRIFKLPGYLHGRVADRYALSREYNEMQSIDY